MTAADNAHLAEVAGLVSKRAGAEFNMLFRRAHEFRTPSASGGEIRGTTVSDGTAAAAIANLDGRPDPLTTLEGDLVKARQQVIWWCNRILALADQAVAVDTAQRARAGTDDRTVDDINRSDGYCQACGSPRYHHGIIGDRLILTHGTLKCCESCRSRWRRTTPQTDSAWQEFLLDAKHRGLAARDGVGDVEVAS
jgi:hypothetical protein